MGEMSREMMQQNVIQWLDELVIGAKATQRRVTARAPKFKGEYEWRCEVSTPEIHSILTHRLANLFDILCVTPQYCFAEFGRKGADGKYEDVIQYIVYKDIYFYDYMSREEYENERSENENLVPLEELPVLNI